MKKLKFEPIEKLKERLRFNKILLLIFLPLTLVLLFIDFSAYGLDTKIPMICSAAALGSTLKNLYYINKEIKNKE